MISSALEVQQISSCILNYLTHWGQDKMAGILAMTFSISFSSRKKYTSGLEFRWSFFK